MRKGLFTVLLIALTYYSPLELSRLIVHYGLYPAQIFELCVIWTFYIGAIFVWVVMMKVK